MNILLLNGHGGSPWDCGARGCGYDEADLVRECTDRVEAGLRAYANVYRYPKDRNAFQDIENGTFRSTLNANFPGVKFDYAFERHFNAFNGDAHGTECFVTSAESGITVEQAIMKRMEKYFALRDNDGIFDGVKRMNFLVIQTLKNMGISGALLETCFIDNASDMDVWAANKAAIDADIVDGIVEGFGLGETTEVPQPKPQPTPTPAPQPNASTKYDVGTPVCTCHIWESSTDTGAGYTGDWQDNITRVIPGARHPYLIGDGIGWTDDASIDGDPHIPGSSASTPSASTGGSAKYSVGTHVCTNTLATSSTGGKVYKGDWRGTITRVIPGAPYPYLLNDGTGWTNDAGIDSDPHTPR